MDEMTRRSKPRNELENDGKRCVIETGPLPHNSRSQQEDSSPAKQEAEHLLVRQTEIEPIHTRSQASQQLGNVPLPWIPFLALFSAPCVFGMKHPRQAFGAHEL